MQHRTGRDVDQLATIVDLLDIDPGGQDALSVDLFDFGFDTLDGWQALLSAPHEHDALHDVVVLVETGYPEARFVAHADGGDIAQHDRQAIARRQHGVANLVHGV